VAKRQQSGGEHEQGQNDTHGTPVAAIDLAWEAMGGIDWDPFGNPRNPLFARLTTLLPVYEDIEPTFHPRVADYGCAIYGDAFAVSERSDWRASTRKFINGPWSDLQPCVDLLRLSDTPFAWVGPSRTNAKWFQDLTRVADVIWYPCNRFMYVGSITQPPFHSCMAFRGVDHAALRRLIPQFFPKDKDPTLHATRYLR
jgi:hypothetical protein